MTTTAVSTGDSTPSSSSDNSDHYHEQDSNTVQQSVALSYVVRSGDYEGTAHTVIDAMRLVAELMDAKASPIRIESVASPLGFKS